MKRDYIDFQDRSSPVGYLIRFAVPAGLRRATRGRVRLVGFAL